jgi:hypothetical protein
VNNRFQSLPFKCNLQRYNTVASVTIPSLASVYNEFALKKNFDTSVHLQNFFMYFYGRAVTS